MCGIVEQIKIVSVALGIGASDSRCADGPLHMVNSKDFNLMFAHEWYAHLQPLETSPTNLSIIVELCKRLAKQTHYLRNNNEKIIVLGGDHSCAIGTWSGIAQATESKGDVGLLWIDAHMDAHTLETTKSGNIHGMPMAALLGEGCQQLTNISSVNPKFKPQNVCLIGVRSYEIEEFLLLQKLGVKVYFIDEVKKRGINNILKEALEYVSKDTIGYGLSIDLDAFEPEQVPGVGTPVENGIDVNEFMQGLVSLKIGSRLLATEVVEYNPSLDIDNKSTKFVSDVLNIIYSERG